MGKAIAIIPARGGSKGIPRKNLVSLLGRPLLAYALDAAKMATLIETVFVTTDDPEIASIAQESGASVIQRPAELATDKASSESALLHALEVIGERRGGLPECFTFIQCTSPLIEASDIDGTLEMVLTGAADTAFTAARFHGFLWQLGSQGAEPLNHPLEHRPRRQDLPDRYLEAGSVYAMNTAGFLERRHRFFGRVSIYEVPVERCIEIDAHHDVLLCEAILKQRRGQDGVRGKR